MIVCENEGFGKEELLSLQALIEAENSDLFDVLEYVSFAVQPISREERVNKVKHDIMSGLDVKQREFIEFVLEQYVKSGVEELDQGKIPKLLELKYRSLQDGVSILGGNLQVIRETFLTMQKLLYRNVS